MIGKKTKFISIATVIFMFLLICSIQAMIMIDGTPGNRTGLHATSYNFSAKSGYVLTPDGDSILFWGLADGANAVQYPSPTMIIHQGDLVTVTLTNQLNVPVSLVFPGQDNVTATSISGPSVNGLLTLEATGVGSVVQYTFLASNPGTYIYNSGTNQTLQIEMGLVGAIIVRPADVGGDVMEMQAYGSSDTMFDEEFLFLETEMDVRIHDLIDFGQMNKVDLTNYFPSNWFLNGRCAPDTMADAFVPNLPNQPYNCMPMMHPGEKLLMRIVVAGRDIHPFHHHANNAWIIAKDGRLLSSGPNAGAADLAYSVFTIQSIPGETVDALFTWTGEKLGWDIYGHMPSDPLEPNEYAPDHGKPIPVILPENQDMKMGEMWSGSPFLGLKGNLLPGDGALNMGGGYYYMWHSHTEKEMVNYDVFPGGMMTMLLILPWNAPIMK